MYVIGTAGHVDHGKSTLVKSLTGIDPDRLREEQVRGMTIDLGFAWLKLPSGREVSLVDVPGHERFIKNMLAGVGGIDLALIVVAADEGPMPQTEEHLAILELLRVKRAVVALTKKDLVDDDWLGLVVETIRERLAESPLSDAPIVPVSAYTGEGLPSLLAALDQALTETPARADRGRPRLPIDRVFTMAGFGTIVTGTLIDGRVEVGQELEVQPGGRKTRARGVQMHRRRVDVAEPGSRVAINLVGVAVEDLHRGQVVTVPGWLSPTQAIDVRLQVLPRAAAPLEHNARVTLHTGAAEAPARVLLLDGDAIEPGSAGWAQLKIDSPIAVAKGDLFVIRSAIDTIGGGEVVDSHARRHRRRQHAVIESLQVRQSGSPAAIVLHAVERRPFADPAEIGRQTGLPVEQVRSVVAELVREGDLLPIRDAVVTPAGWAQFVQQVTTVLEAYHHQYPLRVGMPKEELRSRLGLAARTYTAALDRLVQENVVRVGDVDVARVGHIVRFRPEQEAAVGEAIAAITNGRFAPPSLTELGLDAEVVNTLVDQGKIVRVSESLAFAPEVYDVMVARIQEHIRQHGSISVSEVRDMFDTSRRYGLAVLEYLDEQRITRRVGDHRVLR